jgi:DNA replication and repair protein RecF
MLANLRLNNFRCFDSLAVEFSPGFNFFVGRNGQGKTSILEAACVLLRLQSQRGAALGQIVRFGEKSFAVAGHIAGHRMDFQCSPLRRRTAFDQVEQRTLEEYLRVARVVSFANTDIELVRGGAEMRRRYIDFLAAQIDPVYRPTLRAYERALRSRNAILKSLSPRPRELAAYTTPLLEHGSKLSVMRAQLVGRLAPMATAAHCEISATDEKLEIQFLPGNSTDFAGDLVESQPREARLRQTVVGPHRDDIQILVQTKAANHYASEGQQRTVALALKIAQSRVFMIEEEKPPILLIDDIFGELDPVRRKALLQSLPSGAQKLVTATTIQGVGGGVEGPVWELKDGCLIPC